MFFLFFFTNCEGGFKEQVRTISFEMNGVSYKLINGTFDRERNCTVRHYIYTIRHRNWCKNKDIETSIWLWVDFSLGYELVFEFCDTNPIGWKNPFVMWINDTISYRSVSGTLTLNRKYVNSKDEISGTFEFIMLNIRNDQDTIVVRNGEFFSNFVSRVGMSVK